MHYIDKQYPVRWFVGLCMWSYIFWKLWPRVILWSVLEVLEFIHAALKRRFWFMFPVSLTWAVVQRNQPVRNLNEVGKCWTCNAAMLQRCNPSKLKFGENNIFISHLSFRYFLGIFPKWRNFEIFYFFFGQVGNFWVILRCVKWVLGLW